MNGLKRIAGIGMSVLGLSTGVALGQAPTWTNERAINQLTPHVYRFGGPQNGLGSRITATVSGSRATMWAYVLAAMLLGLLFYLVSIALESLTTQHRGASPKGDNT